MALALFKNKCNINKGGLIMKNRLPKIIGIGLLVATLAIPVVVLAQGWGGGHMMGHWGQGSGYMTPNDKGNGNLTPDQKTQIEQLDRKYFKDTADLNDRLWRKSSELNALLNTTNPDTKKVKALFREVNDLRSQLDEKNLDYNLERRKIIPDSRFGGYESPQGGHMGGYGPGMMGGGMMGPGMMGRGYGN
jgi:zinc resistance-associated protein